MNVFTTIGKGIRSISKEIDEIREIRKDSIKAVNVYKSIGDPGHNTISYKLGKTIIDSKDSIYSLINTPKKLYSIYEISKNKDLKQDLGHVSNHKVSSGEKVKSGGLIRFKSIDDYRSRNTTNNFKFENFVRTFGIKSGERVIILNNSKVFFEGSTRLIYTSSDISWKADKFKDKTLRLESDFKVSSNLEIYIIISFYENNTKERLTYKVLNINKEVNIKVPSEADYFKLGLKVSGEGVTNFNKFKILLKNDVDNRHSTKFSLSKGISIIIPSYKGENTIIETLESIREQKNIDLSILEIIIIVNGQADSTIEKINTFRRVNPQLKVIYSYCSLGNASNARNIAIHKATKEFCVFCDDDDLFSDEYLAGLYKIRSQDSIGFCRIYDLKENGEIVKDNPINKNLLKSLEDSSNQLPYFSSAITMIASKILPTINLKEISFNQELKSGEDVVFFMEYYSKFSPKLVMSSNDNSFYIRRLRDNSVSRQKLSFDFNIVQRLEVIKNLEKIIKDSIADNLEFIESKIRAQCGFIINYLKEYPDDYQKTHLEIVKLNIESFPYKHLQDKLDFIEPSLLVISYCHPPFVDTSAVVSAKRVYEFNEFCDVISVDMSSVRNINPNLIKINRHLIKDSYVISTPPTFGGWKGIYEYCKSTILLTENKYYQKIYSRSFWPASHFAAFEYKKKNPNTKWIAEFSDPVIFDIEGNVRSSDISKDWVDDVVHSFKLDPSLKEEQNLYVWCELIVYLFADEIIFTCENQRKLMLSKFPHPNQIATSKAIPKIIQHPTLPIEFYNNYVSDYKIDHNRVNIAYFGAFYKTRRLDDLLIAVQELDRYTCKRSYLREPLIHIFTEQIEDANEMIINKSLNKYFKINPYVNYLEFLNICKKMDVLIVNDASATNTFGYNPYLPSKISDYLGSGSDIWAFYEEGSAIAISENINYFTKLGSKQGYQTLIKMINEKNK